MAIWRHAAAMILPLSMAACSLVGTESRAETLPSLSQVPPNGIESLDESDFRYFQKMGPLEHAVRLGGTPDVPVWRVRLRLYPVWQDSGLSYQVKADHYNLSPVLYDSLVSSYGEENVDPSLDNVTPHQHIELEFLPIMNVTADWLSESTQMSQSPVTSNPTCGLGLGCAELAAADIGDWGQEHMVAIAATPWKSSSDPLPGMVRTLAQQAGWLQESWTMPAEVPEGISDERPWVEVLITNYPGNGGGYLAQWIERVADDSVRSTVHQLYLDPMDNGIVSQGYVCARGADAGQLKAICP